MGKRILILALLAFLPILAFAGTKLTLHECIQKALENNPSIRSAQEGLNAGNDRINQVTASYLPQVQASTGYSEDRQLGGAFGEAITKGYTTTLSLNQIVYDFGKTGNTRDAAIFGTQAEEMDLNRVVQDVILDVRQSYFALLQAEKLVGVVEQTLAQAEGHQRQAEAFFRDGSKPRFDVTRAEVDVNSSRLDLINAQNSVRLKTIKLYNAMGVDPERTIEIEDILSQPAAAPSLEQASSEALKNRPEMLKVDDDIQAARARVRAEKTNYLPTLSVGGAYNWASGIAEMGPFKGEIQNSWNAGITLTMSLFEGGLTNAKVSEAMANQRALEAQRDTLRQSILFDVNQAFADFESAATRIGVMDISLKNARESLELAEGRYDAGIGPSLEVTDARVAAAKAEIDYVQALYDYQISEARLAKAMGKGLE